MKVPQTIPATISVSPNVNMLPFIRGFQGNMTHWMSNLISQLDGCMRLVGQWSSMGFQRQERLEQTIAMMTPTSASPDRDHIKHLQKHLACKTPGLSMPGHNVIFTLSKKF